MAGKDLSGQIELIKSMVSIPRYFEEVIIPQMPDYYSDYTVDFDAKPVVKCPLHGEDTPSLRYYDDTNTFYCFGCRAGGDVISLHRQFIQAVSGKSPTFEESVTYLYKYFVQGKEDQASKMLGNKIKPVGTTSGNTFKPVGNTKVSLSRFGKYLADLESMLSIEKEITEKEKLSVLSLADNMELLVSLDIVKVDDAIKSIKESLEQAIENNMKIKEVKK